MVKKITTLTLDEDLLKYAKKEIPNLSGFFENCVRAYLQDYNIFDIEQELNKIKEASLNIHILTSKKEENDFIVGVDKETLNSAWINIWGLYRNSGVINSDELAKASVKLHLGETYLKSMMEDLKMYATSEELRQCDDWDNAVKVYENLLNK